MTIKRILRKDLRSLERRRTVVSVARSMELSGSVVLAAYCLLVLADRFSLVSHAWIGTWKGAGLVVVLSIAVGAILGLTIGQKRSSVAMAADKRYGLKERITAAEECLENGRDDVYSKAILSDFERHRDAIVASEVYPLRHRPVSIAIPIFLALIIAAINFSTTDSPANDSLSTEGALLEEFGRTMAARAEDIPSPEATALAEQIERLGVRMQNGDLNREESARALEDMAQRIDGQVRGLSRNWSPAQSEPVLSQRLRDSLNQLLEDQLTSGEARELKQELRGTGAFSKNELDTLDQAFRPFEDPDSSSSDTKGATDYLRDLAKSGENEKAARELLEEASGRVADANEEIQGTTQGEGSGTNTNSGESNSPVADSTDTGRGAQSIDDGMFGGSQDANSDDGDSSGKELVAGKPGSAEVDDSFGAETQLKGTSPELDKVEGTVDSREAVKALVRSLPGSEMENIEETFIIETYVRQIEEIVASETIPESTKSYVRDYFLSIGLTGIEQGDTNE